MHSARSHVARTRVVLADTDAAGVVYFSRVFDLAHRCYEQMMEARGLPLQRVLAPGRPRIVLRSDRQPSPYGLTANR